MISRLIGPRPGRQLSYGIALLGLFLVSAVLMVVLGHVALALVCLGCAVIAMNVVSLRCWFWVEYYEGWQSRLWSRLLLGGLLVALLFYLGSCVLVYHILVDHVPVGGGR